MMQLGEHSLQLIALALKEDIGAGDITTAALVDKTITGKARIIAKEPLVVCGQNVALEILRQLGTGVKYEIVAVDGTAVGSKEVIATLSGSMATILSAERTILNFLQRLSGVASATKHITEAMKGTGVQVLDTRKTTPGWRELEKYAVRVGGGKNHRIGLFDAVLIKNNHLDSFQGSLGEAVARCRKSVAAGVKIEIEVRNSEELIQAIAAKPDEILLDNFTPEQLVDAVRTVRTSEHGKDIKLEASGGIRLENIAQYAVPGLDFISMGQLTHSVISKDIALRYQS